MIADENTPLVCGTSSRRAGTRALPELPIVSSDAVPICYLLF